MSAKLNYIRIKHSRGPHSLEIIIQNITDITNRVIWHYLLKATNSITYQLYS